MRFSKNHKKRCHRIPVYLRQLVDFLMPPLDLTDDFLPVVDESAPIDVSVTKLFLQPIEFSLKGKVNYLKYNTTERYPNIACMVKATIYLSLMDFLERLMKPTNHGCRCQAHNHAASEKGLAYFGRYKKDT